MIELKNTGVFPRVGGDVLRDQSRYGASLEFPISYNRENIDREELFPSQTLSVSNQVSRLPRGVRVEILRDKKLDIDLKLELVAYDPTTVKDLSPVEREKLYFDAREAFENKILKANQEKSPLTKDEVLGLKDLNALISKIGEFVSEDRTYKLNSYTGEGISLSGRRAA